MNRAFWGRVEDIYHAALPLGATERAAYLNEVCAGEPALFEEVCSLLAADAGADDFLREPAAGLALTLLADDKLADTLPFSESQQPHASSDLVGTKVAGRYEVTELLGEGGFGEVYKALDANVMSRPVVVKVLKDAALRGEEEKRDWLLTKFRQEIEALSRIQDTGVVGVIDADTLPDRRPYIVLEFVRGSNLRDFMKTAGGPEGVLKPRDVGEIIRQAARTLTAAHDAEVIHRDLKPENIMVRRDARGDLHVKIIDFGIAKVRNSLVASSTATGHFTGGTRRYMSPEQLSLRKVGPACDIYALGVIAYEMVTGRPPFAARDVGLLMELQKAGVKVGPRDLNPELPEAAQRSILKALSYFPADRHERARDFGDELARALAEEEELAPRPAPPAPPEPEGANLKSTGEVTPSADAAAGEARPARVHAGSPARARRRRAFAFAAILLAALAGFAAWLAFKTSAPRTAPPQAAADADAGPERTLTYWLSMQRPRDAKPFDSVGERVFEPGSQFWFNVQTSRDGALYLFSEGHVADRPSELNTLFPTPRSGRGDARLAAGRVGPVTEGPNKFRGASGTIYLWVIWADRPVALLDEIVRKSYDTAGNISDAAHQTALRTFIEQHREPRTDVLADDLRSRVTLKGRGEILLDVRKLEYQP